MGFQIAIDDLGEGFSSLRLWSELRPDFVKIDRHFIQGINQDPVKLQFVRSIQEIAQNTGSQVIAEGIETQSELLLVRELGIDIGQGYLIARPNHEPALVISTDLSKVLLRDRVAIYPHEKGTSAPPQTLIRLLRDVAIASPDMSNNQVLELFAQHPEIPAIPVVDKGAPIGLINRTIMIDRFARLYQRELFGSKSCFTFMDEAPLIVDKNTTLQELSHVIADGDSRHLSNGFIITDNGKYLGIGTGHDLMREITQMQISAARYANPLTLLPGSVPINEHMDRLLINNFQFCLCYFDIDHFKPFNDVYGYRKGDDIIQLTGQILEAHSDPELDMVGHVGGDDFIIVFQSDDWEKRCHEILSAFSSNIVEYYNQDDVMRGGYVSEDRRGKQMFHSLASLSIGAVRVDPSQYGTTYHIASAASEAKMQAKKIPGNSIFVERRKQ
jgi:diguanylate cyclase (GGDEF)-like protein